jgi:hypothetical protein
VDGLGLLLIDDGVAGCLLVIVAVAISSLSSPMKLSHRNFNERRGSVNRGVEVVMEDSFRGELEVGRSFDVLSLRIALSMQQNITRSMATILHCCTENSL